MQLLRVLTVALVVISLTACSFHWPRVHRITIQQGNVMTQEMIDKLKPGMTRRQVAFVMGEPVIRNSFNPDRWDYVYSVLIPNIGTEQVRMSLFFENEKLTHFSGDLAPSDTTATEPSDDVG
ncbi:MAG: outer membrane protein assembly factor BamE [Gammaproteobacteria bacterium]|nr:outer membrane protein assembly factor BamE [Gammaproteobacteria bacterium]